MADTSKSPRPPTKSTKNDGGDESWKDSKPSKSDPKGDRGKGNYKVNDVDLSAVLPVPMYYQFTDDEKKMFAEFRKASKTCTDEDSDYIIGRFLVARKFKLKDSVELFDSARAWREKENVDDIIETFPDNYWYKQLLAYWPTSIHPEKYHWTKDGCPIVYERIGQVTPKMGDLIPRETLVKHHLYNLELMEHENYKIAKKNEFSPGTILIEDLEHLTTSHLYNKITALVQEISACDEQHYPESVRRVYIINPPGIFNVVWALMKPFIEERTLQKFSFGSPKDFADEWDKIIGVDNLPKYLGGNMDWAPPAGGDVASIIPSELVKKEIARKDELFIEVAVKAGQTVHWQVMCKKDIGIGLFIKTGSGSKDRKSIPEWNVKKYDGDLSPHHGWWTAPEDLTVIVWLDNTDSWAMARKVKYFTYVKDPLKISHKEKKEGADKKEEGSGRLDKKKSSRK